MANLRECLACEQPFDPTDYLLQQVSEKFKDQYCSESCEKHYEQYLLDYATKMESFSLPSSLNQIHRSAQNNSGIDALIAQFRVKDKQK